MRDHLMGYPPAAWHHADWPHKPYPLGIPRRVEEEAARQLGQRLTRTRLLNLPMITVDNRCMTQRDQDAIYPPLDITFDPYKRYDPVQAQLEREGMEIAQHSVEMTRQLEARMAQAHQQQANVDAVAQYNAILKNIGAISGGYPYPCDEKIRAADQHACQQEHSQMYLNSVARCVR